MLFRLSNAVWGREIVPILLREQVNALALPDTRLNRQYLEFCPVFYLVPFLLNTPDLRIGVAEKSLLQNGNCALLRPEVKAACDDFSLSDKQSDRSFLMRSIQLASVAAPKEKVFVIFTRPL